MHPNPAFRPSDQSEAVALAREWGFGMLAVGAPDGPPLLSHVPFLLDDAGRVAELHLTRSTPIAVACTGDAVPARLALQGPHGYISPDWYEMAGQVPTWNYVAVHLTGRLVPRPQAELPEMLARLSAHFEATLAPKPEWLMDKLDAPAAERMMRMIRPFRFEVDKVDSTWKLSQNKPESARLAAADRLAAQGPGAGTGQETRILAALMRRPPGGAAPG